MIEENTTQMRMTTDTASVMQNAVQTALLGEDEIDLGEYEIVRPEFFAHVKEPALTVNVDKIGVNCLRPPDARCGICADPRQQQGEKASAQAL